MIIKTTLCGSNPQVIRELYIGENRTVSDLLSAVAIVHGLDPNLPLKLIEDHYALDLSERLENLGKNQKEVYVSMTVKAKRTLYSYPYDKDPEEWIFRLDIDRDEVSGTTGPGEEKDTGRFGKNQEDEESPRLLRFRGMHPDPSGGFLRKWNYSHQGIIYGGHLFRVSPKDIEDRLVNLKSVNRHLRRRVVMKKEDIRLNRNCCHDLSAILESYTVDVLKNMVRDSMKGINYKQRKRDLIYDIKKSCNSSYWKDVLEEMDLEEYESFRELCIQGNGGWDWRKSIFPVLRKRCLLDDRSNRPYFPYELMDYYESLLLRSGEEELILKKKVKKVIMAASNLYGVFTKAMCKQLAVIMYPKEVDPKDISLEWKETDRWKSYNNYTMYDYYNMDYFTADDIMNDPLLETYGYYIPGKEEAFQYAQGEMNYTEKGKKRLQECLSRMKIKRVFCWDETRQKELIIYSLYEMCHLEIGSDQIRHHLKNDLYLEGTAQQMNHLLRTVKELKPEVRSVDLHGYTEQEIHNMKILRQ